MASAPLTRAKDLRADEIYKYVRLESGAFRFARADYWGPSHYQLLEEGELPLVVSAGTIRLDYQRAWFFTSYGSITCDVGWDSADAHLLAQAIGRLMGVPCAD